MLKRSEKLYDSNGNPLSVASELGHGGEGIVYELICHKRVAKVYDPGKLNNKGLKIKTMIGLKSDRLLSVSAWPIDTVHFTPGGPVVGLISEKVIDHKDIHLLYNPKSRKVEFPHADLHFLIRTASNLAIACDVVHQQGHVIGDLNPNNILVSQKATIKLIDCDSFQVHCNSIHFPCGVGVPIFTAPELQNKNLANVVRTKNHDNFGLALLIFHLLFLGRHPFAGKYLQSGEMELERAITECRFAYGSQSHSYSMEQPPNTPQLNVVSEPVANLFVHAFSSNGVYTDSRPTPREWINALDTLIHKLTRCTLNNAHFYPSNLTSCPWCSIEGSTGVTLFVPKNSVGDLKFNLDTVWTFISQVKSPGPIPELPPEHTFKIQPSSNVKNMRSVRYLSRILGIGASAIIMVLVINQFSAFTFWAIVCWIGLSVVIWNKTKGKNELREKLDIARQRFNSIYGHWQTEASDKNFSQKLSDLQNLREQYLRLSKERDERIKKLQTQSRELQFKSYLDQFKIEYATISGIGPSKKAMLAAYGIDTALDVEFGKVDNVPGFGQYLAGKMMNWRKNLEQGFVYDPKRGLDPTQMSIIDREISATKSRLQSALIVGPGHLINLSEKIQNTRKRLWPEVIDAYRKLIQANVDLKAS